MKRLLSFLFVLTAILCIGQSGLRSPQVVGGLTVGSSSTLRNGLVAAWYLDGNGNDSSGNGNNLTAVNTPEWNASGIIGSCFATNATPNGYLNIAPNNFLQSSFSVSFWLKRTGANSANAICGIAGGTSGKQRWYFADTTTANRIDVGWSDDGTNSQLVNITTVSNDVWSHIVFTADASSVKIYTNGVIKATSTSRVPLASVSSDFRIGRTVTSGSYFRGFIDEFYYWDRKITDAEVVELYNGGSAKRP